ncbi:copper radical oxidase [Rhodotorula toruloides]|uniref:Copper radical oxidase n=1 Tax=Rhodotorula toruloides TaxID=5286 RepID=A0A511KG08_RHOTO|nr:copper radical oxidase [Rhodotorula toruloides]
MPPSTRLALVALSALLSLTALATPDPQTLGIVDFTSDADLAGDEFFNFVHDGSYTEDLLPAPEPADWESDSSIFERSIDGSVAVEGWHAHSLQSHKRGLGKAWSGKSTWAQASVSGVAAMQVTLVDDDHIVIYDKAETNPLHNNAGESVWGAVYSISTQKVRPLDLKTNSFCAGGGWISNGTLVSVGGNPRQQYVYSKSGLAAVRLFTPCSNDECDVYENPSRIRLTSSRCAATDNPTFEFFPPKGDGLPIYSNFLHTALNSNLFPVLWLLPNGYVFMAANQQAMIYDVKNNVERHLKKLPNGVTITYPGSAATALLPLTIANNYRPEVLFCGGTTANLDINPSQLSATYPASKQCSRMALDGAGVRKGWIVEEMPSPRVMGDAILLPDATVLIVNGAAAGVAGYGNVRDEIGASNARTPVKQPILYDPTGVVGKRFSNKFPKAKYERLYHSTATLIPDGRIWVGGSNPNDNVSKKEYATRYQVELLSPPYMSMNRPTFAGQPAKMLYGKKYSLTVSLPKGTKKVQAFVMDLGYSTHGAHMSQRMVELAATLKGNKLTVTAPKTTGLYPPGPGWIHILADGIPSKSTKIMVGPGNSPPVSQSAIANMLKHTKGSAS